MAFLSLAFWSQKLTGVAAQAITLTICIGAVVLCLVGGLAWLREDARLDERRSWETKMANARAQELLLRQRREREASAVGSRAERDLLKELDASEGIINALEKKLSAKPIRTVCYPKEIVPDLNR